MTEHTGWLLLLSVATVVNGLLAGASLDESIEQLPARHRIGVRAYSAYSRASHVANGRFWLIPLGIGAPVLTLSAAIWARMLSLPSAALTAVTIAALLSIAHLLSTWRAASINLRQWRAGVGDDERLLGDILNQFARWQALRAALQGLTFVAMVWATIRVGG
jgi:hypothetical protein